MIDRKRVGIIGLLVIVMAMISFGGTITADEKQTGETERLFQLLPNKQNTLHDLASNTVEEISLLTGENSPNKTQSRFNVWGTDLGSFAELNGKMYMFCGDTFGDEKNGDWRSNVLFIIEDEDFTDGLNITDAIVDEKGSAKELLGSLKRNGAEMTVIPTNLFSANGKLYCMYMSVAKWGEPGQWDCRHSALAVSEDGGETWEKLKDVQWPRLSNFIQTANVQIGETMYFWGIPSGRFGGVALMKVSVEHLENLEEYAYYTGLGEDGEPLWVKGSDGIAQATTVIDGPVGEISVMYNEYLGNFIITYLDEQRHEIVLREGIFPWGEYSETYSLVEAKDYPALYGAYMHPKYVQDSGKSVYFAMSQYFPVYNVFWMRVNLP